MGLTWRTTVFNRQNELHASSEDSGATDACINNSFFFFSYQINTLPLAPNNYYEKTFIK